MSDPASDPEPGWLDDACDALLQGPNRQPESWRRRAAVEVGARAADAGIELGELIIGVMRAAETHWNRTPTCPPEATHHGAAALLSTVRELLSAAIEGYTRQTYAELARHDGERTTFVHDLLTGRAEPGELAERAQRYGIRLSATHVVLVARAANLTPQIAHRVDAALAERFGDGNTITTLREQDVVCISAGGLRGISAELAHLLLTELGAVGWQIAAGRPHPGLAGLARSLHEARDALDHAARLGFTTPVLNAADLLVFPVLLRDRDAITDLVDTVLGPLTTGRGGARPYLHTLTVLFDNQGNYTATARQLHLSVRAVTYRLDRIRDLTGYHPSEPTQRFTLQAAVLGARLLGWPAD